MLPPNLSGTTAPDNTTVPDTTNPDTTKPDTTVPDTTVPEVTDPEVNVQNNGGEKDNSVLIAVLIGVACVIASAIILIVFIPKKSKK